MALAKLSDNWRDHWNRPPLPDGVQEKYECPEDCGCNKLVYWFWNESRQQYYTRCEKWMSGHWVDPPGVEPRAPNTKRSKKHKGLVKEYSKGYCEDCLVPEAQLNAIRQPLEAHHIIPFAWTKDSSKENIRIICQSCHADIEHKRRYRKHIGQWTPTNQPDSYTSSSQDSSTPT